MFTGFVRNFSLKSGLLSDQEVPGCHIKRNGHTGTESHGKSRILWNDFKYESIGFYFAAPDWVIVGCSASSNEGKV